MAADGVGQFLASVDLCQQRWRLLAVRVGILLKINVVQKPHQPPEILLLAVAQFAGVPTHDALHRQRVLQMEGVLVVFQQQLQRLLACDRCLHDQASSVCVFLLISVRAHSAFCQSLLQKNLRCGMLAVTKLRGVEG